MTSMYTVLLPQLRVWLEHMQINTTNYLEIYTAQTNCGISNMGISLRPSFYIFIKPETVSNLYLYERNYYAQHFHKAVLAVVGV